MHTLVKVFLSNIYVLGSLARDTPLQLFCWTEKRGVHNRGLPQEVIVHSVEAQKKTKQQVTAVGWKVVWMVHVEDV